MHSLEVRFNLVDISRVKRKDDFSYFVALTSEEEEEDMDCLYCKYCLFIIFLEGLNRCST